MKIVVIGGSGLIGSKLVQRLRLGGHDVIAASPSYGVDTVRGIGLAQALEGAEVVVDVANSPSFEATAALAFFLASGRNLLPAEVAAGVRHHVALSVVGADRNPESGYLRAKVAQESLIRGSSVPYTILRATQFFEFVDAIARAGAAGDAIRLSPAMMQPVAADDVAAALAEIAVGPPVNGTIRLAGPEPLRQDELVRRHLAAVGDRRRVIADPEARYFGAELDDRSLVPAGPARIGRTRFADWLLARREAVA